MINFANADSMAGMVLYIYDYHRETKEVYIEYAGWPEMTVYDNGYIKEEASYNHGRSNIEEFWPYSLFIYNDKAEYVVWCEQYNQGNEKEIIWHSIISEEKCKEMFSSQAVRRQIRKRLCENSDRHEREEMQSSAIT